MKLSELIPVHELQALCDSFTTLTGAVTAVLDLEGNILVATGWQDVCTKFHRVNGKTALRCQESDTALAGQLKNGERYNVYKCKNGLVDVAVPLIIGGEHLGNFFTGQFFFEQPDITYFIHQANEFGFDRDDYLNALAKAPIFSEEKVRAMMEFRPSSTRRPFGSSGKTRTYAISAAIRPFRPMPASPRPKRWWARTTTRCCGPITPKNTAKMICQ